MHKDGNEWSSQAEGDPLISRDVLDLGSEGSSGPETCLKPTKCSQWRRIRPITVVEVGLDVHVKSGNSGLRDPLTSWQTNNYAAALGERLR